MVVILLYYYFSIFLQKEKINKKYFKTKKKTQIICVLKKLSEKIL